MLLQFIDDRSQIAHGQYKGNPEYLEMSRKHSELFKQISAMLPEEGRKLLQQYDNLDAEIQAYTEEYLFLQALRDGATIKDFLAGNVKNYNLMLQRNNICQSLQK